MAAEFSGVLHHRGFSQSAFGAYYVPGSAALAAGNIAMNKTDENCW